MLGQAETMQLNFSFEAKPCLLVQWCAFGSSTVGRLLVDTKVFDVSPIRKVKR